ncbi:sugar-binding transcriptional regulator [Bauldia sp.]|uniref:sugar-binding transcriptional regulator n=1 Tax=Bauldia sp. TaxID=2575872 RepID=UPI003BAB01AB
MAQIDLDEDEAMLAATLADEDRSLMLRAAWLYFIEEQTQADIAETLGVSRFRINRALAECRRQGLVQIQVTSPLASCLALEQRVTRAFGVREAIVVPSPADPARSHVMIAAGLARYVGGQIADPQKTVFGFGWGQTIKEMLRFLDPVARNEAVIVTLLGTLPHSAEENSIEIIAKLGRMLGAERRYMTAPIYVDSPEARYMLAGQHFFSSVLSTILASDLACFAVGNVSDDSLLVRHGLPKNVRIDDIVAAGAVGDFLGTFIDIDGRAVDHPINRQLVGPGLEDLRSLKSLVLASGGPRKVDILTGALRTGLVDVLVSDETTVEAVLALHEGDGAQVPLKA